MFFVSATIAHMRDHENEDHFHEVSYSINLAASARGWADI
jgi:hypothetical protein